MTKTEMKKTLLNVAHNTRLYIISDENLVWNTSYILGVNNAVKGMCEVVENADVDADLREVLLNRAYDIIGDLPIFRVVVGDSSVDGLELFTRNLVRTLN